VATYTGSSRWITGPESRQYVHDKRARVDGIITGIGTVLADDPMLDIRLLDRKDARAPHRIVLDPQARLPIGNRLAVSARRQPVTVIVSDQIPEEKTLPLESLEVNILRLPLVEGFYGWPAVLQWCAQLPMNEVLIEAGPKLVGSAFDARVIDSVICFLAPKLAGGQNSPSVIGGQGVETIDKTPRLVQRTISFRGKDVLIEGDLEYPSCAGNNSASGRFDEPGY
jgi:diaminohydroxyphosphoribosylaminopyrimidine deaminase/5-amino-6-(5-phosphoribosylamino)uracil reductase